MNCKNAKIMYSLNMICDLSVLDISKPVYFCMLTGMKRVSLARQVSMSKAVQSFQASIDTSIKVFKSDR
jgi:hypothetical protein